MQEHIATTPFGRRPATLGDIASRATVRRAVGTATQSGANVPAAVNKWQLFRTLSEIRGALGISDRSLSVLNALLSFHPETALSLPGPASKRAGRESPIDLEQGRSGAAVPSFDEEADPSCDLVVFPSNRALCLRAHGMSEATLRRHLAALVGAGLILRRDSPNGKRYARRAGQGESERFTDAFGFDLVPLVARAAEFEALAEAARQERRARLLLKERISLLRRDAGKLIALGLDEALPGDWESFRRRFIALMMPLRRLGDTGALRALAGDLAELRDAATKALETGVNLEETSGNADHFGRHQSNSNTEEPKDFEPSSKEAGAKSRSDEAFAQFDEPSGTLHEAPARPGVEPGAGITLGLVMEACPDVSHWAAGGRIRTWPEFLAAIAAIRPMLGISPDAWRESREALGDHAAHIAVAAILQRSEHSSDADGEGNAILVNGSPAIRSPGGYLRALTEKALIGEFALGPLLMALIGQRLKAGKPGSRKWRASSV